jgi:hypothetical protein
MGTGERKLTTQSFAMEERTRVGIECPVCHRQQFLELEVDSGLLKSPMAEEIRKHLLDWVVSRCPDHLGPIAKLSKN